ncbi:hypothetical protein ACROYT_G015097 [Oculina patagonica]
MWRENIREKVKDAEVGAEVYKMLRTVFEETSEATFSDLHNKMLSHLQDDEKTASFHKYFLSDWVPRAQEWAFCYRCALGINTTMYVEAFHRMFKHNYLKGKFNKCVDTCLLNLIKFIRDKTYERTIKLTKGKLTTQIKDIQRRHLAAIKLNAENIKTKEQGEWEVTSKHKKRVYKEVYDWAGAWKQCLVTSPANLATQVRSSFQGLAVSAQDESNEPVSPHVRTGNQTSGQVFNFNVVLLDSGNDYIPGGNLRQQL